MKRKEIRSKLESYLAAIEKRPARCLACQAGFDAECYAPTENGCCCTVALPKDTDAPVGDEVKRERGGQIKGAEAITDVQSTGRKRAAVLYPIEEGSICEWSLLGKAGGGVVPIIGCSGNLATDRHHGPDKNTLNNTETNVHRICAFCHNYWHAQNDQYYGERPAGTQPFIPLDGNEWFPHDKVTKVTEFEVLQEQVKRKVRK